MKSYNSCDDVNTPPLEAKVEHGSEPVSSLLTNRKKISPSASAALLVGILEIIVGVILLFPGSLGIIYTHYGLITYGCYGVLLIVLGILGTLGIKKQIYPLVHVFFVWKIISVFLVAAITAGVIIMVLFKTIPEVSNWWFSIIIIGGLGLVFEFWSIGGILWIRPLWTELKDEPMLVVHDSNDTIDLAMLSKDPETSLPPPPQLGVAPLEDPMRTAVRLFNKNPDSGIRFLTERNLIDGSFKDVGRWLHRSEDLNTTKLGEFLGENKPFYIGVLHAYVEQFDFSNMEFDNALREFLSRFRLPGEAQKIDRIMECFAQRYHSNNPGIFPDSDSAYLLAFSLIMLNTDSHNPAIKNKMTKKAFVANNTGIRGKDDIPATYLEMLYDRIVQNEIKMEADGLFNRAAFKGWLEKRATNNKWQKRWFVLKNNCLYYFNKPEEENPRVIIPLEGLVIRKIVPPTTSTAPMPQTCIFEIVDPYQRTIKSVKLKPSGPLEGQHERFVLMAPTPEEAEEWVTALQDNIVGNPVLQLIKKRKSGMNKTTPAKTQPPVQPDIPVSMDDVEVRVGSSSSPGPSSPTNDTHASSNTNPPSDPS